MPSGIDTRFKFVCPQCKEVNCFKEWPSPRLQCFSCGHKFPRGTPLMTGNPEVDRLLKLWSEPGGAVRVVTRPPDE
jgi:hypothetical protein